MLKNLTSRAAIEPALFRVPRSIPTSAPGTRISPADGLDFWLLNVPMEFPFYYKTEPVNVFFRQNSFTKLTPPERRNPFYVRQMLVI